MPLTRYEVRNEYSLANPDLYRAAAKDDPDGLLEGVAMAGLVGIVRQLGDLAEFAAEVFHDLHEEVLATAARGHELLIRIQQLEAELPFVEKLMLAESNYANFAYNPGLEWHANIQNEQNHFTQGDLPRFIRNAYKDCRGPPRLFLLDKFDVAGAGACLKRYTDPSFFRMEWASSELMKAEKEQQDKKARRIKKKARRQREMREALFVGHMQPRIHPVPLEIKNAATSSNHVDNSNSRPSTDLDVLQTVPRRHEQEPESLNLLTTECDGSNLRLSHDPLLLLNGVSMESSALSRHQYLKSNETHVDAKSVSAEDHGKAEFAEKQKNFLPMNAKLPENLTDFTSGTDNYMDAMTTIDSEGETDLDVKMPYQMNKGLKSNHVANRDSVLAKQVVPDHMRNIHKPEPCTENGVPNVQITRTEGDASEVDEPAHARSSDASFAEEKKPLSTDGDLVSDKSCASTPDSDSLPLMPELDKLTINAEELLQSESVNGIPETPESLAASVKGIPETPETLAASDYNVRQPEPLSADLNQPPESVSPIKFGSQGMFSEQVAAVSSYLEDKIAEKPARELPRPHLDKAKFEDFQSDMSEGVRESSPHSSPDSSIQPMKWAMGSPRHPNITVDSDDELDGMQVSPPSLSSSNSALSSPRPSTLATTVFDNKSQYPVSPLLSSPESLGMPSPDSPISSVELGACSSLLPGHVQPGSQIRLSSQKTGNSFLPEFKSSLPDFPLRDFAVESQESVLEEGPEEFPPPPPLPPLKWRTTRKFGGLMSSFNKVSDSSSRLPLPQKPLWRIGESPETADLPTLACKVQLEHDDVLPAHGPSPALQMVSQGLPMSHNVSEQFENEDLYGSDTGPVSSEAPGIVLSEELSTVSGTVDDAVQFDIPFSLRRSLPLDVTSIPGPEPASIVEHPRSKSIPFLQVNAPTQFVRSLSKGSFVDVRKKQDHTESVIYEDGIEEGSWNEISKTPETNVHVSVPHETSDDDHHAESFRTEKQIPVPQRLEHVSRDLLPPLPSPSEGPVRTFRSSMIPKIERKDSLIAAIASHDKSTLRKVPEWSQSSRAAYPDERESLLEQIKTGSFSLRRTKTEKQEVPRPVTNINVAAILEKANAIRQAFVGSDDDDDNDGWSDD